MSELINLFITFLKIGTFSFGGGYAMLPFIQREVVDNNGWLKINEFVDVVGISQMTPGPVSINTATFVGYKVNGVTGSIAATFGVVLISFILVSIANKMMEKFKKSITLKAALLGMRPVLMALIINAFLNLAKESYTDIKSIGISAFIGVLLLNKKVNPILAIVISGVLGIIFY